MSHTASMMVSKMVEKAHELGVTGVAVVALLPTEDFLPEGNFMSLSQQVIVFESTRTFRDPQPEERGEEDQGTNYFGVVMGKIAFMIRTLQNSGTKDIPLRFGESEYRGGIATKVGGDLYLCAFSGGSEDQDVEISLAAWR